MTPKCSGCNNAVIIETGYSNYTVEGSEIICLLKRQLPFDAWFGEDARDDFAQTCEDYTANGPALHVDVDNECVVTDEEKALFEKAVEIWGS